MRKQKHYNSVAEIEKDMASAHRQQTRYLRKAEQREATAESLKKSESEEDQEFILRLINEAKYFRKKANRIENGRLVRLKRTHAAFQTSMFPGIDDTSVVLQRA